MPNYVDRDALRDALCKADAVTMEGIKIINSFPTADVRHVVMDCHKCPYKPLCHDLPINISCEDVLNYARWRKTDGRT